MKTERIILACVIVGIAYGCGIILWPFLSAILWAAILTFTTWPVYRRLCSHVRPVIASVTMMALSAIAIIVPLAILTSAGLNDLPSLVNELDLFLRNTASSGPPPRWVTHAPIIGPHLTEIWTRLNHDVGAISELLRPYFGQIAHITLNILVKLTSGLVELAMALFIAFFLWLSGDALGHTISALTYRIAGPLAAPHLISMIGRTIRGTVYGVLGTAIIQGILTGIGFMICGVPAPVLLGGIAAFIAVFPVGAPIIWVPASLWLMATHHFGDGIFLMAWGVLIISGADHLIRPAFIARGAQLPYLLTVIGVLGGVIALGGLGIFLGPVLLAVGYTLISRFAHPASASPRLAFIPERPTDTPL
ncbi:AI-2E family transporter [Neokomagataea thailandica]|uniref:Transporter n=1 Tax=Neokomagataea tanensis NBRC 106556 TaxID=1223519 RepID=A0ABQ0QKI0_9PROT|nr:MULTISPECIES: AI-2E family transporter [Neokomagataea]GBR48024.1 transporter [Neokomagataea tanensis NBRC 106556]